MDWLIPALGIGVVIGFLVAATTFREFQRQGDGEAAFLLTLDRLRHDYILSLALRSLQDGEVDKATKRLDLLLCWDIVRADAEVASADSGTRVSVEHVLRKIARARPKTAAGMASDSDPASDGDRKEAERVLERALRTGGSDRK